MRRIINYLSGLLLLVWGCSIDEGKTPVEPDGSVGGMTFVVNLPDPNTGPGSYALTEADENKVTTIHVFAFTKEGSVFKLIEMAENSGDIDTDGTNSRKKTFRVNFLKLKANNKYKFAVIANGKTSVESVSLTAGMEYEALMEKFTLTGISNWTPAGKDMPMWGESVETTLTNNMKISDMKLLRMVAKVDVTIDTDIQSTFKLKEVYLYNYRTGGYLVPDRANLQSGSTEIVSKPTPLGTRTEYPAAPVQYTGVDIKETGCTNHIYTFETEQVMTGGNPDFAKMHALVIGATYNGNTLSYYRVNFNKTENSTTTYLDLLRNHRYEINIKAVKGNGYPSKEEAFESKGLNIEAEVIDWNDGEMSEIVYNGQYALSVSQGIWDFTKEAQTTADTGNKVKIKTDYPNGWSVEKCTDSSGAPITWLSLSPQTGAKDALVTSSLVLDENTGSDRTGYIYLKAGNLSYRITVNQSADPGEILVKGITVSPKTTTTYKGNLVQLTAEVLPTDATNKEVTWSSSDETIATVDANGLVTTLKAGNVTLTAKSQDGTENKDIAAITILNAYYPAPHTGWAGSNIYYDEDLGHLTFADVGDLSKTLYHGALFKWGSLIGLSPYGLAYDENTKIYTVDNMPGVNPAWNSIPYINQNNQGADYYRAYLYEKTDLERKVGDICRAMTIAGLTPGFPSSAWRLPTANEMYAELPFNFRVFVIMPLNLTTTSIVEDKIYNYRTPLFLPENQIRKPQNGILLDGYSQTRYWTSSGGSNVGYALTWDRIEEMAGNDWGFSVRCVRE